MVTLITKKNSGFTRKDSDKYGKPFDVSKINIIDYEKIVTCNPLMFTDLRGLLYTCDMGGQMDGRWDILEEQHGNGWLTVVKFFIAINILKKTNLIWWNLSLHPLVERQIIKSLDDAKEGYVLWTYSDFHLYDSTTIIVADEGGKNA